MNIAFITDNKQRVLQGKTMYDSLDTDYIVNRLSAVHDVYALTHHSLQSTDLSNYDAIIYTTSQVYWYKKYVELNIEFIKSQKLIPSIESLLSHENKAYEYMWLKQNTSDCLEFKFYSDLDSYRKDEVEYPIVIKTPSGSSSRGVKICDNSKQATRFIKQLRTKQLISELAMTPFIQWPLHIRDTKLNANFITQQCVLNYRGDYRVQVMGDKFFVYYRELKADHRYTSGSGSVNHYDIDVDEKLLNTALDLQTKINSPHIIFDFILDNQQVYTLEFSAIHPSNVAIDNSQFYYKLINDKWQKISVDTSYIREDYYVDAYLYGLNKTKNEL